MTTKTRAPAADEQPKTAPKKVAAKKAQGRPKKPESEKLEQFSIRLSPKLKFGLELLSRAQHRSLSQAIEWALQVGLNNYEIGYVGGDTMESIGTVVERAWAASEGYERVKAIYDNTPMLLDFEDLKACELIEKSYEADFINYGDTPPSASEADPPEKLMETIRDAEKTKQENNAIFIEFCSLFWPAIRTAASIKANAGQRTHDVPILNMLGLREYFVGTDLMQLLRHITDALRGQEPKTADDVQQMVEALKEQKAQSRKELLGKYFADKESIPSPAHKKPRAKRG